MAESKASVNEVVLVGGSTRIPKVGLALRLEPNCLLEGHLPVLPVV